MIKKEHTIKMLRIAFWIGAITDATAALIMALPELRVYIFASEVQKITSEYRYALGMGAALMTGWTALLIWGSLKPLERRGILVLTVFPVISGIVIAQIYAVSYGLLTISEILPVWIHLTLMSLFFLFAYFRSNKYVTKESKDAYSDRK